MTTVLASVISSALAAILVAYLPRWFPKYPPGTPLLVRFGSDPEVWSATYTRRTSLVGGFHHVRLDRVPSSWYSKARYGETVVVKSREIEVSA